MSDRKLLTPTTPHTKTTLGWWLKREKELIERIRELEGGIDECVEEVEREVLYVGRYMPVEFVGPYPVKMGERLILETLPAEPEEDADV